MGSCCLQAAPRNCVTKIEIKMKKSEAIIQLIEDLRAEINDSTVDATRESKAVVYMNEEDAVHDNGIIISYLECKMIFSSTSTLERFLEALGDTEEASITLFDLGIPSEVVDLLEQRFVAVDEE
jgi:hypothetical protein